VFSALNTPRQRRYEQDLAHQSALLAFHFVDTELLPVRVRSTTRIEMRQVTYSVLPTLIGCQVTVRPYYDRLIVFLSATGFASCHALMELRVRSAPCAWIWSN